MSAKDFKIILEAKIDGRFVKMAALDPQDVEVDRTLGWLEAPVAIKAAHIYDDDKIPDALFHATLEKAKMRMRLTFPGNWRMFGVFNIEELMFLTSRMNFDIYRIKLKSDNRVMILPDRTKENGS